MNAVQRITTLIRWAYPFGIAIFMVIAMSMAGTQALAMWRDLPEDLPDVSIAGKNVVLDNEGKVIATTWSENRDKLESINDVSGFARNALLATEDSRFYKNNGFDVKGTIRSAVSGSGGGSGITQQLVKNLLFFDLAGTSKESATEQTIERKVKELKLAMSYDKKHSKDDILLEYFNTVAFGAPSQYGIESAAQYFFGKSARELNIEESALLIGSVQNPSLYNLESKDPETIATYTERKEHVLSRMKEMGYISGKQFTDAKNAPINLVFKKQTGGTCAQSSDPFYCEYVFDYIRNSPRYGETREQREMLIAKGGLVIKTNLDPEIEKITREQLKKDYDDTNRVAVPTAVVQPGTGAVSAIATNREYGTDNSKGETLINLPLSPSGTGSVFKLMTLAAAVNEGYDRSDLAFSSECPLYTPGYDSPPGGFKNSNSCQLQGGYLDYKKATAYSSNTWYVTLERAIGVEKVKEFANSVGLVPPEGINERSLSYTLGPTEHSSVDMAAAFATFAANGVYCPPTPIDSVAYEDGSEVVIPDTYDGESDKCRSVISPKGASIVNEAMRANVSGEVKGAFGTQYKVPGYDTAGKSGTNELQNSTWVQMAGNYVVYSNVYDPETTSNGIETIYYRGSLATWGDHVVGYTGRDILKQIFDTKGYKPLSYGSTDSTLKPTISDQDNFFIVPSVIGARPEAAASIFEQFGIEVIVDKEKAPKSDDRTPSGVIVEQSIEPDTKLSYGTKRTLEVKVAE